MSELDHQRVLAGVARWDRSSSRHLDEAKAHKTRTAGYVAAAMDSLKQATRAAGHRKLKKGNRALHTALARAHEACQRAQEQCYQYGETYEVEESLDLLERDADPGERVRGVHERAKKVASMVAKMRFGSDLMRMEPRYRREMDKVRAQGNKALDEIEAHLDAIEKAAKRFR